MTGTLLGMWLIGATPAAALDVAVAPMVSHTMNDPFTRSRAVGLGVEVAPVEGLILGLRTAGYPHLTTGVKRLQTQLVDDWHIAPDVSELRARADLDAEWMPLVQAAETPRGPRRWSLGVRVSAGAVYTVDDLALIQAQGDPRAEATEHQVHPTAGVAVVSRVGGPHWELVTALERLHYTEVVDSTDLESKRPISLTVGASRWF